MKSMEEKNYEWCIALDNVGLYYNNLLGPRPLFLKGERTTKEKVFSYIPDMTEEKYSKLFRPATEEEIDGQFDWDGEQYVLKSSKHIKIDLEKLICSLLYSHPESVPVVSICNALKDQGIE